MSSPHHSRGYGGRSNSAICGYAPFSPLNICPSEHLECLRHTGMSDVVGAVTELALQPHVVPSIGGGGGSSRSDDDDKDKKKYKPRRR